MLTKINDKFKSLIPPLQLEEYALLEQSILKEGIRDPLVTWESTLVDGHNRHEICLKHHLKYTTREISFRNDDEAMMWILTNQLGRRNLSDYDRGLIILKLEPLAKKEAKERQKEGGKIKKKLPPILAEACDVRDVLSKKAQISHGTLDKIKFINQMASEETKQKLSQKKLSIDKAYKEIKKEEKKKELDEKTKNINLPDISERYKLYHCDIKEIYKHVKKDSIDAIITDPPYPKEYIPVYEGLSHFALHALKPGGSLVVMCGQSYLPEIFELMTPYLNYHWMLAYLCFGGGLTVHDRRIQNFWKPVLWFVKDKYKGNYITDYCKSEKQDKVFHAWGQSESGMTALIEKFSQPGDTICDPFLGGGTTAISALSNKRLFVGSDIDESSIKTTKIRISKLA